MLVNNKMLVNCKKLLTNEINQHIIAVYQQRQIATQEREEKGYVDF